MARVFGSMRVPAAALCLLVCAASAAPVRDRNSYNSVTWQEVYDFFWRTDGLDMTMSQAQSWADSETTFLNDCNITRGDMYSLRNAMYSSTGLDMTKSELREKFLPIMYKKTSGEDILDLVRSLWIKDACGSFSKSALRDPIIGLAKFHVSSVNVNDLCVRLGRYSSLSSASRLGWMQDLSRAGAEASELTTGSGISSDADRAVRNSFLGSVKRYAPDCKPYTATEFSQYFGAAWFQKWEQAPEEKRFAPDGMDYYAWEFKQWFGVNWSSYWAAGTAANQYRINTGDRKVYSLSQFCSWFGADRWQAAWAAGAVVPSGRIPGAETYV